MNRKYWPLFIFIYLPILIPIGCKEAPKADTNDPPNIIYILADDLGYGDLGCYGQEVLKTPHIDQLAADGIIFSRHYAGSTVCAPSRASLLTAKHTGHTSVRGNYAGQLLLHEETTIAEALKPQGYVSGIFGKWGIGHPPPANDPLMNGFDEAYGYINMWHAHNFYPEFLYGNGQKVLLEGNVLDSSFSYRNDMPEGTGVAKTKHTYAPHDIEKKVLGFIEAHQAAPFFLYYALNIPHANNEAGTFTGDGMEVPDYGEFDQEDWPSQEKGFARMIQIIDESVGKIRKKLKDLGLDEHTIILFSSDNGPHQEGGHQMEFFDSNGSLRGMKRDLYEGGLRVPLIACWPDQIKAGSTSDHLSSFWDILPTFCDIGGADKPEGLDGISFYPSLLGNTENQAIHPYLYWEFYEQGGKQALIKDHWKLVKLNVRDTMKEKSIELYDLQKDPSESTSIAEDHPDIIIALEQLMQEAHRPLDGMSLINH